METSLEIPNEVILRAAMRRRKICEEKASNAFRQVVILSTLAIDPKLGQFVLRWNNGRGKRLSLILNHRNSECKVQASIKSHHPGNVQIIVTGHCSCPSEDSEAVVVEKKLKYIREWCGNNDWMPPSDTANVLCIFGQDESDDNEDTEMEHDQNHQDSQVHHQQVSEIIEEVTITEQGRGFGLEIGGDIANFTLKGLLNFFLKLWFKAPKKITKKKQTKKFFKN